MVAHQPHKLKVAGSNPAPASRVAPPIIGAVGSTSADLVRAKR